eukprot:TRINITY_DN15587_c0_g1_i8.p1 TRINITY_DN15587_c0_g1~~TRINITY_DN15587_c0_g1_i8.p1  ORF type:complete len:302 (+),score=92.52 TRINITY_DN15587_c0_g1_i8:166-1071(+)
MIPLALFTWYIPVEMIEQMKVEDRASSGAGALLQESDFDVQGKVIDVGGPDVRAQFSSSSSCSCAEFRSECSSFWSDIYVLLSNKVFFTTAIGWAALTFVVGALAFWAPKGLQETLNMKLVTITTVIGAIALVGGLVGTWFGGWLLDRLGGSKGARGIALSCKIGCAFSVSAIVFMVGAVLFRVPAVAMLCLGLGNFLLFATNAPISAVILSAVPQELRSLSMAMSIFLMHGLGDLPSPIMVGLAADHFNSVQIALLLLCGWMVFPCIFWYAAYRFSLKDVYDESTSMQAASNLAVFDEQQ